MGSSRLLKYCLLFLIVAPAPIKSTMERSTPISYFSGGSRVGLGTMDVTNRTAYAFYEHYQGFPIYIRTGGRNVDTLKENPEFDDSIEVLREALDYLAIEFLSRYGHHLNTTAHDRILGLKVVLSPLVQEHISFYKPDDNVIAVGLNPKIDVVIHEIGHVVFNAETSFIREFSQTSHLNRPSREVVRSRILKESLADLFFLKYSGYDADGIRMNSPSYLRRSNADDADSYTQTKTYAFCGESSDATIVRRFYDTTYEAILSEFNLYDPTNYFDSDSQGHYGECATLALITKLGEHIELDDLFVALLKLENQDPETLPPSIEQWILQALQSLDLSFEQKINVNSVLRELHWPLTL